MTTDPAGPEPRFQRFLVRYPGAVIESHYLIGGGGTLREVQIEHPLGIVEAVESSRVAVEAGPP